MHCDEDPLINWKKESEDFTTLAALALDYFG